MAIQMESCVRRYFNTIFTQVRIHTYTNSSPLKNFWQLLRRRNFFDDENFSIYSMKNTLHKMPPAQKIQLNFQRCYCSLPSSKKFVTFQWHNASTFSISNNLSVRMDYSSCNSHTTGCAFNTSYWLHLATIWIAIVPNKKPHQVAATKHSSPVYTSHAQLVTHITSVTSKFVVSASHWNIVVPYRSLRCQEQ